MTVVMNMAAVARLENPFRLSISRDQVLFRNGRREKTNAKITTNAGKSTASAPETELVEEPYSTSKEGIP